MSIVTETSMFRTNARTTPFGQTGFTETALRLAAQLDAEAIWDGDRATWLGDERIATGDERGTEVVHRAVAGDLYGGTAGIGVFLARCAVISADDGLARTARGALAHAHNWVRRARPDGSLYAGSAGVAAAALDAAELLDDPRLALWAIELTRTASANPPAAGDLIGGHAGVVLAHLHLARGMRRLAAAGVDDASAVATRAHRAAAAAVAAIVNTARPGPVTGVAWPSDIDPGGPDLCGLAHGASGYALALAEWSAATGDAEAAHLAEEAAAYERSWFDADGSNWPDLREAGTVPLSARQPTEHPVFWCHGAPGIGLARLRQYELGGREIHAAEAGAAVAAAVGAVGPLAGGPGSDLSLCHGVSALIELLLVGDQVLHSPGLTDLAREAAQIALDGVGSGTWPCGVPAGSENPSLFLGLAGIGTTLLRLDDPRIPSPALAYAGGIMVTRIVVQLSPVTDAHAGDADALRQRLDRVQAAVDGSKVTRVSPRGRVLLQLPAGTDGDTAERAVTVLKALGDVAYAELDTVDRVDPIQPSDSQPQ